MKKLIETEHAPKAIGPYSQAISISGISNVVYMSGQIGLDPSTGELVPGGIKEQTQQILKNIQAVLDEIDAKSTDVCKTTIFLKSMGDFSSVNELYGEFFYTSLPARSTVEVSGLPKDALVEVECIVIK